MCYLTTPQCENWNPCVWSLLLHSCASTQVPVDLWTLSVCGWECWTDLCFSLCSYSLKTTSMTPSTAAGCTAWAQARPKTRTASQTPPRKRATTSTDPWPPHSAGDRPWCTCFQFHSTTLCLRYQPFQHQKATLFAKQTQQTPPNNQQSFQGTSADSPLAQNAQLVLQQTQNKKKPVRDIWMKLGFVFNSVYSVLLHYF